MWRVALVVASVLFLWRYDRQAFSFPRLTTRGLPPHDQPRARLARARALWLLAALALTVVTLILRPLMPMASWIVFAIAVLALIGAVKVTVDLSRLREHKRDDLGPGE